MIIYQEQCNANTQNVKQNILKKPFTINLILNSIFSLLTILFGALSIWKFLTASPFPERFTVGEMDKHMIEMGQDVQLIQIYGLLITFGFCLIVNLVTSAITVYYSFGLHDINNGLEINQKWFHLLWRNIVYFLIYLCYFLFSFILVWYVWLIYLKSNNIATNTLQNKLILIYSNRTKKNKASKIIWILIVILFPIITILVTLIVYGNMPMNSKSHLIPDANVKKYTTLSRNQPNVIWMYFDRANAILWNMLLLVDDILNTNNSFIKLFPEFSSYINTISLSQLTKFSNPGMYSGYSFNPLFKNHWGGVLFNTDKNVNQLSQNDWYKYALLNLAKMLISHNIENISFNNLPYYADTSMSPGWHFGNMRQLQDDLHELNVEVNTMTNAKLANYNDYYVKRKDTDTIYDAYVLDWLDEWISFEDTTNGTFFSFFGQQTHIDYVYKQNGKYKRSGNNEYFVNAMWDVIQSLKPFLLKLKKEKISPNSNISVYDQTAIFIMSDHGYNIKTINYTNKIYDYLINQKKMNIKQKSILNSFDYHSFNSVFMVKPFNVDKNKNLLSNQLEFNFDSDKFIINSDIANIIETELQRYNQYNLKYFNNDEIIEQFIDGNGVDVYNNQVMDDVLYNHLNSIKNKTVNRQIFMTHPYNWKMQFHDKLFDIALYYQFAFNNYDNGIFSNENFSRI